MSASFSMILESCKRPSPSAICGALSARRGLLEIESDFVTYIARFTHRREAAACLAGHQIEIRSSLPAVVDKANSEIHVKIFVNDLRHGSECPAPESVARILGLRSFANTVFRRSSNGRFLEAPRRRRAGETYLQYQQYLWRQDPGLEEVVVPYRLPKGRKIAPSLVFHFAWVPNRSMEVNLERLFSNVAGVILYDAADPAYNLSLARLRQYEPIRPALAKALWAVEVPGSREETRRFLQHIGAKAVPFRARAPIETQINCIVTGLETRILEEGLAVPP